MLDFGFLLNVSSVLVATFILICAVIKCHKLLCDEYDNRRLQLLQFAPITLHKKMNFCINLRIWPHSLMKFLTNLFPMNPFSTL